MYVTVRNSFKTEGKVRRGLSVLDNFSKIIYEEEVEVTNEIENTENSFAITIWALQRIRPLLEQGVLVTEESIKLILPYKNVVHYAVPEAKVPKKYVRWKTSLDTEIAYFPFPLEVSYNRNYMKYVNFRNSSDIESDSLKATDFFASLE